MRAVAWIFLWCAVLLSSGCAIWERETTNRGGFLDHLVDQHWLKADSKSMRALRAFAIQVSLARIASVSAKNDADRQLLAIRIGATTKRFLPILNCAFEKNPLNVAGAEKDPCFYYDSAMVDYSTALFDLAMIALPVEDAKKLMNAVTGSFANPLNVIEVLETLLDIGKDALKYGRIVGALYRDTIELEVQIWIATPDIDDRPPGTRVMPAHVAALKDIYDRKSDNMPAWISAMAALRSQGLEPVPHPRFFNQLGGLMRYLCDLITTEPNASKACKTGLPTTLQAPSRVLGPMVMPRGGLTPTGIAPAPRDPVKVERRRSSDVEPMQGYDDIIPDYRANVATYTPSVMKTMQQAICVKSDEWEKVGATTKVLLQIWEATDPRRERADGKISERERKVLVDIKPCPDTLVANYFERQTFLRETATTTTMRPTSGLIDLLNKAPPDANPDAARRLPNGGILAPTATLQDARPRIAQIRRDCFASKNLMKLPNGMANQVTADFLAALGDYATLRETQSGAAPAGTPPAAGTPGAPAPTATAPRVALPSCQ